MKFLKNTKSHKEKIKTVSNPITQGKSPIPIYFFLFYVVHSMCFFHFYVFLSLGRNIFIYTCICIS